MAVGGKRVGAPGSRQCRSHTTQTTKRDTHERRTKHTTISSSRNSHRASAKNGDRCHAAGLCFDTDGHTGRRPDRENLRDDTSSSSVRDRAPAGITWDTGNVRTTRWRRSGALRNIFLPTLTRKKTNSPNHQNERVNSINKTRCICVRWKLHPQKEDGKHRKCVDSANNSKNPQKLIHDSSPLHYGCSSGLHWVGGGSRVLGRIADVRPINIGAKHLASNSPNSYPLNNWAFVCWNLAFTVTPKAHRLWCYPQSSSELSDTSGQNNCIFNWIHVLNSTLVENTNLQVYLPDFLQLFNLAENGNR